MLLAYPEAKFHPEEQCWIVVFVAIATETELAVIPQMVDVVPCATGRPLIYRFSVGTCESEIFVRIESRIGGYNSNLESNQGVIVYAFSDEQRCAVSPGSSNNIARSLLHC